MLLERVLDVLKRRQLSRLVRVGRARSRARGYASGHLHGHRRQGVAPGRRQHACGAEDGRRRHRARPGRGCRTSRKAWRRSRVRLQLWRGLPRRLVRGLRLGLPRTGRAGVAQRRLLGRRIVPQVLLQPCASEDATLWMGTAARTLGLRTKRACLPLCHILTWNCRGLLLSWPTCLYPAMLVERCSTKPSAWMVEGGTSVLASAAEGLQGGPGGATRSQLSALDPGGPCTSGRAPRAVGCRLYRSTGRLL